MTPDQIIAFNTGRRLLRRRHIDAQARLSQLDSFARWMRPRELMAATRLGEADFCYWARQGALHQFARTIASYTR